MHQIDPIKRERATAVLVHFCHTKSRFQEKKIFWALPWENLRLLMWPKNSNSSYFGQNSVMQNCQDYTDPTVTTSAAVNFTFFFKALLRANQEYIQWDQCSPGNSASHYCDQSMMKLDFWPHE